MAIRSGEMYAADNSALGAMGFATARGVSREEAIAALMKMARAKGRVTGLDEPNAIVRSPGATRLADAAPRVYAGDLSEDDDESSSTSGSSTDETSSSSSSDGTTDSSVATDVDVEEKAKGKKLMTHTKLRALAALVTARPNKLPEFPESRRLRESVEALEAREVAHLREVTDNPARAVDEYFTATMHGGEGDARTLAAACAVAKGRAKAAMRAGNVEPYTGPVALAGDALAKQIRRVVLGDLAYSNGGGK